jgi:hypothetical protein
VAKLGAAWTLPVRVPLAGATSVGTPAPAGFGMHAPAPSQNAPLVHVAAGPQATPAGAGLKTVGDWGSHTWHGAPGFAWPGA